MDGFCTASGGGEEGRRVMRYRKGKERKVRRLTRWFVM